MLQEHEEKRRTAQAKRPFQAQHRSKHFHIPMQMCSGSGALSASRWSTLHSLALSDDGNEKSAT